MAIWHRIHAHTGMGRRPVQTTAFRVHPRIRLAQLFQAEGGGPVSPLRCLKGGATRDEPGVIQLKVRVL